MIKDNEALEFLVSSVIALSEDKKKQQELADNIGKLGINKADEIIAKEIISRL